MESEATNRTKAIFGVIVVMMIEIIKQNGHGTGFNHLRLIFETTTCDPSLGFQDAALAISLLR